MLYTLNWCLLPEHEPKKGSKHVARIIPIYYTCAFVGVNICNLVVIYNFCVHIGILLNNFYVYLKNMVWSMYEEYPWVLHIQLLLICSHRISIWHGVKNWHCYILSLISTGPVKCMNHIKFYTLFLWWKLTWLELVSLNTLKYQKPGT